MRIALLRLQDYIRAALAQSNPSLRRLRRRLAATLVALNLAVGLSICMFLWSSRLEAEQRAAEMAENYTRVLTGDLDALFSKIDLSLQSVADEVDEQFQETGGFEWPKLQRFIDRQSSRLEGTLGLRLVDRNGNLALVANERAPKWVIVADRERFQTLNARADAGLVISPEYDRVSGEWVVSFARRLNAADGAFAGETLVSVSVAQINSILSQVRLGPNGVVGLWNSVPAMVARFPALPPREDANVTYAPPSSELRALFAAGATQGPYMANSGSDGIRRSCFFKRLTGLPLYLVVGTAEQDLLSPWRAEVWQFAALYALIVAVSCAAGGVFYSRAAARQIAEEQTRLAGLVYDNSAEGMVVIDGHGAILGVNQAFTDLTGRSRAEVIGRPIGEIAGWLRSGRALREIFVALQAQGRWAGEFACIRASGEPFLARASVSFIDGKASGARRVVALFSDVTEQKMAQEAVWRHANFDPLTALPNRRRFRERLDEEIARARRAGLGVAVAFIDLDRFKEINDSLGHQFGDQLLQEAASRVRACVRASDMVARLGGDEFTVLMSDLPDDEPVQRACAAIVAALAAPFNLGGEQRFVSASLGVTLFPQDAEDAEGLVRNADLAMYEAKRAGRNKHLFFRPDMQRANTARALIANDLHGALAAGQFELHYQPIVALATGEARKAEALIRWRHPSRGLVGPAEFIGIAEETGLIGDIGDWVFREAARQTAEWRERFEPACAVSVNVSPVQFARSAARMREFPAIAREFGLAAGALVVEITEGVLLDATEEVRDVLKRFNEGGLAIALDDFGTGYSSLAYLKQFKIDFLKIDRAFIRGLADEASDLAICEAIIAMAHRLGIKVVAEGIETDAQRMLLAASRCDFGQGYLFARPMPAEAFAAAYLRPRVEVGLLRAAS
jgi:diguanylate cyclase (GGDEF)-like protein/PAS domain S-box-containing protein